MEGKPFGRYRLVDLLGRGGMGEVWRAYDTATERVVALKVLPENLADDPTFQERFRREAKAAAKLDEPHVVPIYDYGEIDGSLYVSMRLISGTDLHGLLSRGPLDPARAVHIIEQIATALHAAHEVRLLHRDVKPSNILVAKNDFAYLIDFGIARGIDEQGMTQPGLMVGTLHYMAPERLSGNGVVDGRSDVYALACVLHQCLTGSRPFPGDTLERQLTGHLSTPPPRPSQIRPGVPQGFDAVIAKGMAKDPNQRYGATTELAQGARQAMSSAAAGSGAHQRVTVAAPQPTPPRPVTIATPPPTPPPGYRPPATPPRPAEFQQFPSAPRTPVPPPAPRVPNTGPRPTSPTESHSTKWKVLNSLWILPGLLSCGLLCWLGWLVAAIRIGKAHYWVAFALYFGLTVLYCVMIWMSTDGEPLHNAAMALLFVLFLGPAVHAAIVNRWYLRDLAAKR